MSQLQHSLEILGFTDIHEISADTLKKAFKVTVLRAHPDKGGDQDEFDTLLSAYLYLLETVDRLNGGRRTLQGIVSPDELKESRIDEVVNRIFEEFQREEFNAAFELQNPRVDHGYAEWLQDTKEDTNVIDGVFGKATQVAPSVEEAELQKEFERRAREGKPEPSALILHPEEMAYHSGTILGTAIIDSHTGSYTSDLYQTPEYTDVYAAFTKENTFCDKLTPFADEKSQRTWEQLLAERETTIQPLQDSELEAISQFEKDKMQKEKEHLQHIKDYYENGYTGGALNNWPPTTYPKETNKNFVIQL
jgi:curved DNA-binding protein CbpA